MLLDERDPEAVAAAAPRRRGRVSRLRGPRGRRLALRLLTVAVTVAFAYIALHGIDLGKAWRALERSDAWWLLPALLAFGLGNLARGMRWRSLFAPGRRPPPATTLNAMMIGYLYNNIMPARAGEAARIVVLRQRSDAPPVEIASTVLLERLYDVLAILLVFLLAQPWLPSVSWFGSAAVLAGALAVAIAATAAALVVYGERPLRALLRPLRRFAPVTEERLERTVAELAHGLSGLHDARVAAEALLWTLLAWLLSIGCSYMVVLAFHLPVGFWGALLVVVAVGASMVLPAAPASIGVFEGAALIALKAYGLGRSTALPYALVLHLVNFIPFVLVGAALLHHNARHPPRGHGPGGAGSGGSGGAGNTSNNNNSSSSSGSDELPSS